MALERMDAFFNARVAGFDEHMLGIEGARETYERVAALLPTKSDARVLDLGCGTGLELDEYFKIAPDARVTCVDLADELLQVLKAKHPDKEIAIIRGSYFDIDFGREMFDAVVTVESLHHFEAAKKKALYASILRALAPGGVYVEADYVAPDDETERALFAKNAELRKAQGVPDGVFMHFDTPHTLAHLMEMHAAAGFCETVCDRHVENTAILVSRKAK